MKENNFLNKPYSRREFLRLFGKSVAGAAVAAGMMSLPVGPFLRPVTAYAENADLEVASSVYGWVLTPAVQDADHKVTVEIMQAPSFEKKTYTTTYPLNAANPVTGTCRADALAAVLSRDCFVEIMFNAAGEVIDMELVLQAGKVRMSNAPSYVYFFTSAKYGGELTAPGGGPGRMVAQGWVLKKDASSRTITIGDGNHVVNTFEETYTLADDCKIFKVNNGYCDKGECVEGSWDASAGTFEDITLCPVDGPDGKCPGEIYYQREKYTALCIFDGDYTTFGNGAKVTELYLFRNPYILTDKQMIHPDNSTYDGVTWTPVVSKLKETHQYGFDGSCEPFEVLKNRLYSIGDSYTCIYLIVGDDGSLTMVDQGNWCATYQYWLNMEKMGFDPRQVKNIILTHGHGDHYQALYENVAMNNRYHVGKGDIKRGEQYLCVATSTQDRDGYGYLGYPELTPELSDNSIRYCLTMWDEWYEWRDLGGGAAAYPFLTVGHSKDTASFGFLFEAREGDAVFAPGKKIGWVYMGGYGAKNDLKVGYQRLAYVDGLKYLQSVIGPYMDSISDYVYNLPQHTNQYPWHDVYKCSKAAGIPFMEGLCGGLDAIQNFCEKRISYNTYEKPYQQWLQKTDKFGNALEAKAGFRCSISSAKLQTIEAYGPFKRPAGTYEITVEHALVLHGYDAWQNVNEKFAGQTNIYGYDLSKGLLIDKDSFIHDPDRYFVQVVCKVKDDYQGKVDYETNWYGASNYAVPWVSGPVEIVNRQDSENWTEIIRTARVNSREEAEEMLAGLKEGGTYRVELTQASEIVLAENLSQTFVPVE